MNRNMEHENVNKQSAYKIALESGHYFRPITQMNHEQDKSNENFERHREARNTRAHWNSREHNRSEYKPRHHSTSSTTEAFPGTTSLVQVLDRNVLVVLRDGKKYVGILRSYDQYGTIVLHDTSERIYIQDKYGEQHCGVYLIRGENIMLLCEIDQEKDSSLPLEKRPMIEMLNKQKEAIEESRRLYRLRRQIHRDFGNLVDSDMIMMDSEM